MSISANVGRPAVFPAGTCWLARFASIDVHPLAAPSSASTGTGTSAVVHAHIWLKRLARGGYSKMHLNPARSVCSTE